MKAYIVDMLVDGRSVAAVVLALDAAVAEAKAYSHVDGVHITVYGVYEVTELPLLIVEGSIV